MAGMLQVLALPVVTRHWVRLPAQQAAAADRLMLVIPRPSTTPPPVIQAAGMAVGVAVADAQPQAAALTVTPVILRALAVAAQAVLMAVQAARIPGARVAQASMAWLLLSGNADTGVSMNELSDMLLLAIVGISLGQLTLLALLIRKVARMEVIIDYHARVIEHLEEIRK